MYKDVQRINDVNVKMIDEWWTNFWPFSDGHDVVMPLSPSSGSNRRAPDSRVP